VYLAREDTKIRKTFLTLREAKAWRADAMSAANKGKMRGPTRMTVREETAEWLVRAATGATLTKGARRYKPSFVREVERSMRLHVLDEIGALRLSDVRRADVQRLIERLNEQGLSGSRVRGVVTALKVVLRRALEDDELSVDPTARLRLPEPAGSRERVVSIDEGERLISSLPKEDQALWATALYAGLRRGELRALRWGKVDLAAGVIRVRESMDDHEGVIAPKSKAGIREAPVPPALIDFLTEHKARSTSVDADALVFPGRNGGPFTPSNIRRKAAAAWRRSNEAETKRAEEEGRRPNLLEPVGLHELRHSWVSHLAEAGFTLEEAAPLAGHSAASMTARYRHVFPGTAAAAAERLGAYLDRANTQARIAQLEPSTGAQTGAHGADEASLSERP
jgi:integrase